MNSLHQLSERVSDWVYRTILSVPVHIKVAGIAILPVLILGMSLNYWVTTGLSDWLSYLLTDVRVEAAMRAGSRSVLLVTFLGAAGSILLSIIFTYILTRPLLVLREMADRVVGGDLAVRAPIYSNDEIGQVATAVNTMTDYLVTTQEQLARTNRQLTAVNSIALAADRHGEIQDILYIVLEDILRVANLETGWIYLRDPELSKSHLASWYNVPPELQDCLLHSGEPACSCLQSLATASLDSQPAMRACQRLESCPNANQSPYHLTIPIVARDIEFGVINLLNRPDRQFDSEDLAILSAIGAQVSEIVANAWLRIKLTEKEIARQALLESLVEAQEEERRRLANELHDSLGQMLTSLLVRIKTLEKRVDDQELKQGLDGVLDNVSETIEQVRDISYRLRPVAMETFGLEIALETLVTEMAHEAGLEAHCEIKLDSISLPPGLETAIYRITQEAVTNVVRHAQATHLDVILQPEGNRLCLTIEDNGRGFSAHEQATRPGERRHLGLISMNERAGIIGGSLAVFSAPDQGTTVKLTLPMVPEQQSL
jgi:signal transduction histidine kinase